MPEHLRADVVKSSTKLNLPALHLSESKIAQFDNTLFINQDIVCLDILMHEVFLVGSLEAIAA